MGEPTVNELKENIYIVIMSDEKSDNKIKIPIPVLARAAKKTLWSNFGEFCDVVNRDTVHVAMFFQAELSTTSSMGKDRHLILRGRFQPQQIEVIMKQYLKTYVQCPNCKKGEGTVLERNKRLRLMFMKCKCGAETCVPKIR